MAKYLGQGQYIDVDRVLRGATKYRRTISQGLLCLFGFCLDDEL